jgi:hypothetical protein
VGQPPLDVVAGDAEGGCPTFIPHAAIFASFVGWLHPPYKWLSNARAARYRSLRKSDPSSPCQRQSHRVLRVLALKLGRPAVGIGVGDAIGVPDEP